MAEEYKLKVTRLLYEEIYFYNLQSTNGYSAETFSDEPEKQDGFNKFWESHNKAKRKGHYYFITVSDDLNELYVAKNCLENVAHFARDAAVQPKPNLRIHCLNVLSGLNQHIKTLQETPDKTFLK